MAFCLERQVWKDTLPSDDELNEHIRSFTVCEHLVYLDEHNNTVNLIHQSTKEFLLSKNQHSISSEDANRLMFRSCWRYLTAKEVQQRCGLIHRDKDSLFLGTLSQNISDFIYERHDMYFLRYALDEWLTHAFAAAAVFATGVFEFDRAVLEKAPILRDTWLLRASEKGQAEIVRRLLEQGAEVNSENHQKETSLLLSVKNGHKDVVMELLTRENVDMNLKDNNKHTTLMVAVMKKDEAMVELLHTKG